MTEVISVRFRGGCKNYYFDPKGHAVKMGDQVIVETAQGPEFGTCTQGNHEVADEAVVQPLCAMLRLATDAWTGAERDAVERGRMAFEDVLTFREDVYDLLRQHTPPKQRRENGLPWAISEDVRKGKYATKGMSKLIENYLRKQLRVPAHYIESMKHIRYLPRKGDCVGRMMFEGER